MKNTAHNTILQFNNVSAAWRIEPVLHNINWHWQQNQQWALLGGNGAGKSTLANLVTDELRPQRGNIIRQPGLNPGRDIIHLSFDLQRQLIEHDVRYDDSESREDAFDAGTTVRQAIVQNQPLTDEFARIVRQCGIAHILERGIRFISTGESRKTLLARALYARPEMLILDNPYEGLDQQSQTAFASLINELLLCELKLLILVNQPDELPDNITHALVLKEGRIETTGTRAAVLAYLKQHRTQKQPQQNTIVLPLARERSYEVTDSRSLIKMRHVNVIYNEQHILNDINWDFNRGQHCCISGPNGAGKSTLLSLICGDNHKAYGQDITLFGQRRGSGESIWEIKEKFGVVSTALQLNHTGRLRVSEVVASGLYDTVGLYQDCQGKDRDIVLQWLKAVELEEVAHVYFKQLSFGQQRLAMLARAMVKSPLILILDEPCLGLDEQHRQHILMLVDKIAQRGDCHILYVSHTANEMPACINQHLQLIKSPAGGFTAKAKND